MRLQIFSDLHADVRPPRQIEVALGVDAVVLAGDICEGAERGFRQPFRTLRQKRMEHERVTICLLHKVGDEAKQIGGVSEIEINSIRLANFFEQMLDKSTQLFAKIDFGSTKTLNKK